MATTRTQATRASIDDLLLLWGDTVGDGDYLVWNDLGDPIIYGNYTNWTARIPQDA